ncbi:MAG TPA: TIGR00730 family Rossman fold protein, partial [Rikenellaceae bacterium]|nr:TIGR00730 family Rossman fold protein [Rikenellaceae bacterium]
LNINGFYDHLLALIGNMVNEHFLKEANMNMILISDNIPELLDKMENYKPVNIQKWL